MHSVILWEYYTAASCTVFHKPDMHGVLLFIVTAPNKCVWTERAEWKFSFLQTDYLQLMSPQRSSVKIGSARRNGITKITKRTEVYGRLYSVCGAIDTDCRKWIIDKMLGRMRR